MDDKKRDEIHDTDEPEGNPPTSDADGIPISGPPADPPPPPGDEPHGN